MHIAIQLIFDPQHDTHRAREVERAWRARCERDHTADHRSTRAERRHSGNVLVVLNGPHTADQRWVQFEVMRAFIRGTPMIMVDVSCIRDEHKLRAMQGRNPLDLLSAEAEAQTLWLKEFNPNVQKWQSARAASSVPRYAVPYPMNGNGPWLLSSIFPSYRWTDDWGERNLDQWVDQALTSIEPAAAPSESEPALIAEIAAP